LIGVLTTEGELTHQPIDRPRKLIDKTEARQYVAGLLNFGRWTLDWRLSA
jgi:hypothetical protein